MEGSGLVQMITDPDPEDPKTSRSRTLINVLDSYLNIFLNVQMALKVCMSSDEFRQPFILFTADLKHR